ncbi:AraC family transcriptional regulator [Flammeovirgaceae bacterium SG7u.111]|nr:AraC family transcriptional regulator [Flammeovirgaceae bacterium SG7u.132]WPO37949.1 AraC family transcriptional regulator [Flammeovirgaceae bacterium SG7u.111]
MKNSKKIPTYDIDLHDCSVETKHVKDFEIHKLEDLLMNIDNVSFPHRHAFYNLLFFTSGSGTHTIDFKTYEVAPYTMFFMSEGQVHSWKLNGDAKGYSIFFTQNFFEIHAGKHSLFEFDFFHNQYNRPYAIIEKNEVKLEFRNLLKYLFDEVHQPKSVLQEKIIWSYLNILLLKIQQFEQGYPKQKGDKGEHSAIRDFELLVQRDFLTVRKISDYADQLHMTPNYLNALCKKTLGKNAKGILNDRLVLEAKRLLYNSNKTISEISFSLKFKDTSYFSRFFRKNVGASPEEFRSQKKKIIY